MKLKLFFVFLLLPAGICLAQDTLSPVLSLGFHRTIFGIDTAVIGGNCVLVAHRSGRPGTYFTSDGAYLINTADFSVSDTITGYTIYDVADVNNDGYPDFIGKDLDDSVIVHISPDHNTKLYSRHINWGKFVKSDSGYKIILGERVEFPGFVSCAGLCDGCVPPNVGYTQRWGKYYLNAAVYDSEVNFVDSLPSCPFPSCIIGDNFYGYLRSGCYIRCWNPAGPFGDFCEDEVIKHKIAKYRFNNEENTFDSIEISDTVVGGIVDFDVGIINGDDTLIALVAGPPSPLLAFWVELWFEDTMISTLH
ncbi:MAG TPA: hypothetical protein ENG11_05690, partial [candidate division Zixibacteria bacterium]|nr:hypothetical protein [candidate division Zixibacteria bacterium]